MTSDEIPYHVTFHSDWAVGAGRGTPGVVDQTARRDEDDLPCLPGRSATGLWRDAVEQVVTALARHPGSEHLIRWAAVLFGTETHHLALQGNGAAPRPRPQPAVLGVRDARLSPTVVAALRRRPPLVAALFTIVPGVRLDRETGTAKTDMLRFVERVRAGLTLHGVIEPAPAFGTWTDEQRRACWALLTVAATLIHHVGGDRRRGAGRCTVTVDTGLTCEEAVQVLRDLAIVPIPAPNTTPPARHELPAEASQATVELTLHCRRPVLVTSHVIGNIAIGLDHVPGSRLLGALAERLRAAGYDADAAIQAGRLAVTDATPRVAGKRGLPAPRCLTLPKGARSGTARNLLRAVPNREEPGGGKPLRGYVAGDPRRLTRGDVSLETRVHNTIHDHTQCPTGEVGGVYSHEAIPADTVLRAQAWLPADWAGAARSALGGRWRLGASRKDEYGVVEVRVDDTASIVDEPAGPADDVSPGGELVVWLTSMALVRDAWGEPVVDEAGLRAALAGALGVELTPPQDNRPGAALTVARRESWQRAWGLPRPSLVGVAPGSVIRAQAPHGVSGKALAQLERKGIGERTAEGFGRVLVNPPLLAVAEIHVEVEPEQAAFEEASPAKLSTEERQLLDDIERAAVRAEIERRAAACRPEKVLARGGTVELERLTRAQWGVLRERVADAAVSDRPRDALARIPAYLDAAAARRAAWDKAPTAREAIKELVSGARVWELLGLTGDDLPGINLARWRADDEMFAFAVARTLDIALSRRRRPRKGDHHGS